MYLWIKALHVVAVISWMAAMLYLPRLFVYHCGVAKGSDQSELFKVMERRLLKAIMTPAMIISWAAGLWLIHSGGFWSASWLHAKLAMLLLLSGIHGWLAVLVRQFNDDRNTRSSRYFRILNEAPTLLMIGIVIMVIVKPF
ncbi:MAG: protoporphyrinogen oxidase HemJ [Bosea sp. (in: a-proteobacteria)]